MTQANIELMAQQAAAVAGRGLQVGPVPGGGFAFQPVGVISGVDPYIFIRAKLQSGFLRAGVIS